MRFLQAVLAVAFTLAVITAAGSAAPAQRAQAVTVQVAFLQGEQVVYLERPGTTLAVALKALLAGPTPNEKTLGVTTQVPAGTTLRGVSVKRGVATVDLGDTIAKGNRAESLTARIAQVVLTATRFRNVRYVRVLVKGGTPLGLFPGFVTRHPLRARDVTAPDVPAPSAPAPVKPGASSAQTRSLQQALAERGFMTPAEVDGRTGARTTSAVVAFQKWARLARDGVAGPATRAALAASARPTPIGTGGGHRIEVLLDRQLVLVVDGSQVTRVIDVSTGKPGFGTPAGAYQVTRKERRSWSVPYKVWLPWASYFVGGVAFHEYPDVPPYPASHGCVRVPRWDAVWLYEQTPIGTPVAVLALS